MLQIGLCKNGVPPTLMLLTLSKVLVELLSINPCIVVQKCSTCVVVSCLLGLGTTVSGETVPEVRTMVVWFHHRPACMGCDLRGDRTVKTGTLQQATKFWWIRSTGVRQESFPFQRSWSSTAISVRVCKRFNGALRNIGGIPKLLFPCVSQRKWPSLVGLRASHISVEATKCCVSPAVNPTR